MSGLFNAVTGPMNAAKIYGTGIALVKQLLEFTKNDIEPGGENIIKMQLTLWKKQIEFALKELQEKEDEKKERDARRQKRKELKDKQDSITNSRFTPPKDNLTQTQNPVVDQNENEKQPTTGGRKTRTRRTKRFRRTRHR
jgi:hypothetical protein